MFQGACTVTGTRTGAQSTPLTAATTPPSWNGAASRVPSMKTPHRQVSRLITYTNDVSAKCCGCQHVTGTNNVCAKCCGCQHVTGSNNVYVGVNMLRVR